MNEDSQVDFERLPGDQPSDETDLSLRAYLAGLCAEHLAQYDPSWSDEQVLAWDPEVIVTPAAGSSTVTGLQFISGNDSNDRDPTMVALYGTNDAIPAGVAA